MRAAVLVGPGRVVIDEVPDPEPGSGEVRISVGGVGLCGSDSSVFHGRWSVPAYPWIMGHEAFGTVDAVGPGVRQDRLGETVVIEPNLVCFACDPCKRSLTSACTKRQSVGMNRSGAMAERVVVPTGFAWPIAGIPAIDLVCVEPTAVALAAIRRLGEPLPASALVVGVGALGLVVSLSLMESGVGVHVQDVNPARLALATELGAVPSSPEDADLFAAVVDTVGSPSSMAVALDRVEVGGTLLCLGLDDRPLDLNAQSLVRRQLTLRGSLTYDHPRDFEAATRLVADGRFAPGRVVTNEYQLEQAQIAFERCGFTPGKTWIRVSD